MHRDDHFRFGSVFIKKNNQTEFFFFEKKTETEPKPGQTDKSDRRGAPLRSAKKIILTHKLTQIYPLPSNQKRKSLGFRMLSSLFNPFLQGSLVYINILFALFSYSIQYEGVIIRMPYMQRKLEHWNDYT